MKISSAADLLKLSQNKGIGRLMVAFEAENRGIPEQQVIDMMKENLKVMREAVAKGMVGDRRSVGGLIGGEARKMKDHLQTGHSISGGLIPQAAMMALAVSEVNASMGKIVAAPTAGSCGVLPGAILAVGEMLGKNEDEMTIALFTAAGVGLVIAKNATLSGAEGGCQAECGSAAAMAAAACVELAGGSSEQCLEAAALTLKNGLGLVCDPVAGLVEVPCAKRNAIKTAEAITAAEMALAGITSVIPFDEVVQAMCAVGKQMPASLKETALGGLAATPTAKKLEKQMKT